MVAEDEELAALTSRSSLGVQQRRHLPSQLDSLQVRLLGYHKHPRWEKGSCETLAMVLAPRRLNHYVLALWKIGPPLISTCLASNR